MNIKRVELVSNLNRALMNLSTENLEFDTKMQLIDLKTRMTELVIEMDSYMRSNDPTIAGLSDEEKASREQMVDDYMGESIEISYEGLSLSEFETMLKTNVKMPLEAQSVIYKYLASK